MTQPPSGGPSESARLLVLLDDAVQTVVPLSKAVTSIGREPGNDLTLPHASVSRRHAEVRLESVGPVLTDLGSSNGTFVGQSRLLPQQPRMLRHGDTFGIGAFTLRYEAAGQAETVGPEETQAPPEPVNVPATGSTQELKVVPPPAPALPVKSPPARPTILPPSPPGPVSAYLYSLPSIFQDGDFLGRYLMILESIWEPLEQRQDHIAMYFDPRTCSSSFLPWMADWFGLPHHDHWPESRVRARLAEAADLYRWRGTPYGLARMIEVTTGLTSEITEKPDEPFVFHIRISVPDETAVDRDLIEGLIEAHKPAHTGYVLEIGP